MVERSLWKQVIFSDDTIITARPVHTHKLRWARPMRGLNPRLVIPLVSGGGSAILTLECLSTFRFHDFVLLEGTMKKAGYAKVLEENLLPIFLQNR
jgi:hypothetical protein